MHAGQEVDVLWAEPSQEPVAAERLFWPLGGPADVLHLVVRDAQRPSNRAVGGVLARARCRLLASESEQQHSLTQLRLMLLGHLREAKILLYHFKKSV